MGQIQKTNGSFAQERSSAVTGKRQTVQYNPESSKDKWLQAALTIEGKLGNWDLTVTGGHLRRKTDVESDYSDYAYFYRSEEHTSALQALIHNSYAVFCYKKKTKMKTHTHR